MSLKTFFSPSRRRAAETVTRNLSANPAAAELNARHLDKERSALPGILRKKRPVPSNYQETLPTKRQDVATGKLEENKQSLAAWAYRHGLGKFATSQALTPFHGGDCSATPKLQQTVRREGHEPAKPVPEIQALIDRTPQEQEEFDRNRFKKEAKAQQKAGIDVSGAVADAVIKNAPHMQHLQVAVPYAHKDAVQAEVTGAVSVVPENAPDLQAKVRAEATRNALRSINLQTEINGYGELAARQEERRQRAANDGVLPAPAVLNPAREQARAAAVNALTNAIAPAALVLRASQGAMEAHQARTATALANHLAPPLRPGPPVVGSPEYEAAMSEARLRAFDAAVDGLILAVPEGEERAEYKKQVARLAEGFDAGRRNAAVDQIKQEIQNAVDDAQSIYAPADTIQRENARIAATNNVVRIIDMDAVLDAAVRDQLLPGNAREAIVDAINDAADEECKRLGVSPAGLRGTRAPAREHAVMLDTMNAQIRALGVEAVDAAAEAKAAGLALNVAKYGADAEARQAQVNGAPTVQENLLEPMRKMNAARTRIENKDLFQTKNLTERQNLADTINRLKATKGLTETEAVILAEELAAEIMTPGSALRAAVLAAPPAVAGPNQIQPVVGSTSNANLALIALNQFENIGNPLNRIRNYHTAANAASFNAGWQVMSMLDRLPGKGGPVMCKLTGMSAAPTSSDRWKTRVYLRAASELARQGGHLNLDPHAVFRTPGTNLNTAITSPQNRPWPGRGGAVIAMPMDPSTGAPVKLNVCEKGLIALQDLIATPAINQKNGVEFAAHMVRAGMLSDDPGSEHDKANLRPLKTFGEHLDRTLDPATKSGKNVFTKFLNEVGHAIPGYNRKKKTPFEAHEVIMAHQNDRPVGTMRKGVNKITRITRIDKIFPGAPMSTEGMGLTAITSPMHEGRAMMDMIGELDKAVVLQHSSTHNLNVGAPAAQKVPVTDVYGPAANAQLARDMVRLAIMRTNKTKMVTVNQFVRATSCPDEVVLVELKKMLQGHPAGLRKSHPDEKALIDLVKLHNKHEKDKGEVRMTPERLRQWAMDAGAPLQPSAQSHPAANLGRNATAGNHHNRSDDKDQFQEPTAAKEATRQRKIMAQAEVLVVSDWAANVIRETLDGTLAAGGGRAHQTAVQDAVKQAQNDIATYAGELATVSQRAASLFGKAASEAVITAMNKERLRAGSTDESIRKAGTEAGALYMEANVRSGGSDNTAFVQTALTTWIDEALPAGVPEPSSWPTGASTMQDELTQAEHTGITLKAAGAPNITRTLGSHNAQVAAEEAVTKATLAAVNSMMQSLKDDLNVAPATAAQAAKDAADARIDQYALDVGQACINRITGPANAFSDEIEQAMVGGVNGGLPMSLDTALDRAGKNQSLRLMGVEALVDLQPNWTLFEVSEHRALKNETMEGPGRHHRPDKDGQVQPMTVDPLRGQTRDTAAEQICDYIRNHELNSSIDFTSGADLHFTTKNVSEAVSKIAGRVAMALHTAGTSEVLPQSFAVRLDLGGGQKKVVTFRTNVIMGASTLEVGVGTLNLGQVGIGGTYSIGLPGHEALHDHNPLVPDKMKGIAKFSAGGDAQYVFEYTHQEGTVFGFSRPGRVNNDNEVSANLADLTRLLFGIAGQDPAALPAAPGAPRTQNVEYTTANLSRPSMPEDKESLVKAGFQAFGDKLSIGRYESTKIDHKENFSGQAGFGFVKSSDQGGMRANVGSEGLTYTHQHGWTEYDQSSGWNRIKKTTTTSRDRLNVNGTLATLTGQIANFAPNQEIKEVLMDQRVLTQILAGGVLSAGIEFANWGHTSTVNRTIVDDTQTPVSWAIDSYHNPGSFIAKVAENFDKMAEERAHVKLYGPTRKPTDPPPTALQVKTAIDAEKTLIAEFLAEYIREADVTGTAQTLREWTSQNEAINELMSISATAKKCGDLETHERAEAQLNEIHTNEEYRKMRSIRSQYEYRVGDQAGIVNIGGLSSNARNWVKQVHMRWF